MPKLDTSSLMSSIKTHSKKGINISQSLIDKVVEEHNRSDKAVLERNSETNVEVDLDSLRAIESEYEQKIALLEKKVEIAESQNKQLTKNEEKLLSAIRSEQLSQSTEWPLISTNKIRKTYKVHPAYFAKSLDNLISFGKVERREATYSGSIKTYKYTILK